MPDKTDVPISTKGLTNDHEILKEANTDDSEGMCKYSIDLDDDMEKSSTAPEK